MYWKYNFKYVKILEAGYLKKTSKRLKYYLLHLKYLNVLQVRKYCKQNLALILSDANELLLDYLM